MEENNNPILDLINNIQANSKEETDSNLNNDTVNTINEVLNNFSNSNNNNDTKEENNNFDLNDILKNFLNNNSDENDDNNLNFDFSTIQKLINNSKKKDYRKDFLLSLKPFLKKERQDKLSQYITYLTIVNSLGIFNKGEDNNE